MSNPMRRAQARVELWSKDQQENRAQRLTVWKLVRTAYARNTRIRPEERLAKALTFPSETPESGTRHFEYGVLATQGRNICTVTSFLNPGSRPSVITRRSQPGFVLSFLFFFFLLFFLPSFAFHASSILPSYHMMAESYWSMYFVQLAGISPPIPCQSCPPI